MAPCVHEISLIIFLRQDIFQIKYFHPRHFQRSALTVSNTVTLVDDGIDDIPMTGTDTEDTYVLSEISQVARNSSNNQENLANCELRRNRKQSILTC